MRLFNNDKNMKWAKLENCKAGDSVKLVINVQSTVYLMTEDNYKRYNNNERFIQIKKEGKGALNFSIPFDGNWYIVMEPSVAFPELTVDLTKSDVDGKQWNNVNGSSVIVHNARNTAGKDNFDKADYWEEQTGETLPQTGYICRSCHESVKREEIDGAHVKLSHVTNSKTYIVPTCQACNRSRQGKDFIVPASWLVELPEK